MISSFCPIIGGSRNVIQCQNRRSLFESRLCKITNCPAGKKILGGGGIGGVYAVIQRSHPNGDFSWWVVVKNTEAVPRDVGVLTVWAICANVN